eukprot:TRINITY_DN64487_c0_g1_i1.p1 TRINITY_DN64487_c0_g1~~TRINITY_DN64487_c0_g1_i1.p1  ORF type:complete len:461 (-),score=110.77 TRINITY_DN64487_c0_g1_i1:59-1441(-)
MALQPQKGEMSGSCFGGLRELFLRGSRSQHESSNETESKPEMGETEKASTGHIESREEVMKQVEDALQPHLQALQEGLTAELQGMVNRVLKAQGKSSGPPLMSSLKRGRASEAAKWQQASAPCYTRLGSKEEPMSPVARRPEDVGLPQVEPQLFRRTGKRRWTAAGANIEGALRVALAAAEDMETPGASTVVSATASEAAPSDAPSEAAHSDMDTSQSPSRLESRRNSLGGEQELPLRRRGSRISFTFQSRDPDDADDQSEAKARKSYECSDDDDEEDEGEKTPPRSDISNHASDTSSVVWRKDALDVGEGLAAEAAAKKGNTSVDSIVALVQTERERWDEEKQALEARLEELKEELRALQAKHQPDAEKEALKLRYQELRKAMKTRSRFGAWVCERHMKESDDEEETDAEKEALRQRMSALSAQLRAARAAVGAAASSESDISPIRRASPPPGPSIRRC